MADYYVDETLGGDGGTGAIGDPWQTMDKVQTYSSVTGFNAGDTVSLKCGETWNETLRFYSDGASGNPIIIKSYDTGAKPIINARAALTGWTVGGNWTQVGATDVWYIGDTHDWDPCRMWFDGPEYIEAADAISVDATSRWWWDNPNNRVYVYATENPSTMYTTSMEAAQPTDPDPKWALRAGTGREYITIQDIEARGGQDSMTFPSCTNIIVDNCTIGLYAGINGISIGGTVGTPAAGCEIKNCTIISGIPDWSAVVVRQGLADGISFTNHVHGALVHDNDIQNWGHDGMEIANGVGLIGNLIYDNTIDGTNSNYMRGIEMAGANIGDCTLNRAYRNLITNMPLQGITLCGNANETSYNIIDTTRTSPVATMGDDCHGVLFYGNGVVCDGNKLYNNVIYNTKYNGIHVHGQGGWETVQNNLIRNNIIHTWDALRYGIYQTDHATVGANTWENNCVYKSGVADVIYNGHETGDDYPRTVAEFNGDNGEGGDTIADNIGDDPLLVNPGAGDFHLQAGSPCRNAGVDVGLTSDYDGVSVPQETYPAIGGYEYPSDIRVRGELFLDMGLEM